MKRGSAPCWGGGVKFTEAQIRRNSDRQGPGRRFQSRHWSRAWEESRISINRALSSGAEPSRLRAPRARRLGFERTGRSPQAKSAGFVPPAIWGFITPSWGRACRCWFTLVRHPACERKQAVAPYVGPSVKPALGRCVQEPQAPGSSPVLPLTNFDFPEP